jgi:hypothetical protein
MGDYRNATDEERAAQKQRFLADLRARGEAETNPVFRRLRAKSTGLTVVLVVLVLALLILESTNGQLRQRLQCYETGSNAYRVQKCLDSLG